MRKSSLILAILLILVMCIPAVVHAAENTYGNEWVYDEADVVTPETEAHIKDMNETVFANYAGKPQLAFIILNDLPYDIDKYKLDMFNEFGVGTKEENHGMLFVFAINDREYALEIGDGFEKGSILRKELETDFITSDMKTSLRNGDYDTVVRQVTEHLADMMADEENGVYTQREIEKAKADQAAANAVIDKINQIGTVEYTNEGIGAVNSARDAYNKLTSEQKKLVSNYDILVAASDTLNSLQRENNLKILKFVGLALCILLPIVGLVFLALWINKRIKRTKAINEMMEKYSRHMGLLKADVNDIYQRIKIDISNETTNPDPEYIADAFPRLLCRYYVEEQKAVLKEKTLINPIHLYELALSASNQADSFSKMRVFDAESIIHEIDEEEQQKAEMRARNDKTVEAFLAANMCRVSDEKLKERIMSRFTNRRTVSDRLVTYRELEEHFEKSLKELSFEIEFNRFCEEHKDEINSKYFDKQKFYNSLLKENNYAQYRYCANHTYNNMWMMHFLMLHMATRKIAVERREREEQEARERRRREEEAAAARRAADMIRNNNSSFGSGFGGGHSSGGGFRGGW